MSFEELTIKTEETVVKVIPERGALVSGLNVEGKEILYRDQATFDDPTKSVRGGIPVLFPFAGKLKDDFFVPGGTKMKQHGFGRDVAWVVKEHTDETITLWLESDDATLAHYPYAFVAEQVIKALPWGLSIDLRVTNKGTKPMPVSPGWHPYFSCPSSEKGKVTGDLENLDVKRLSAEEFDFGVVAPDSGEAEFEIPQLGELALRFLPAMRHVQFWTQPGKDFICIEPFWGPDNAVNTPARFDIDIEATKVFWMSIGVD